MSYTDRPKPGTRVHVEFDGTVSDEVSNDCSLTRVNADCGFFSDIYLGDTSTHKVLPPVPEAGEAWLCSVRTRPGKKHVLLRRDVAHGASHQWTDHNGNGIADSVVTPISRIHPE